jgi:hypothetical protein
MYHTWTRRRLAESAPRWAPLAPEYPFIFGISFFGDLFLCSPDEARFAIVMTERPEVIEVKHKSTDAFVGELLTDEGVQKAVLRADECATLTERLGVPTPDECFYPVPYRALGGSGALNTFERGNVWIYLDVYAQTIGL